MTGNTPADAVKAFESNLAKYEQALRTLTPTPSASAVDNLVKAAYLDSKNADYGPKIGEALQDYNVARELQRIAQQTDKVDNIKTMRRQYNAAVENERARWDDYEQERKVFDQNSNEIRSAGAQLVSAAKGSVGNVNQALVGTAAGSKVGSIKVLKQLEQAYRKARSARLELGAQLDEASAKLYNEAKAAATNNVTQRAAERVTQKLAERTARAQADAEQVRQQEEARRQAEENRRQEAERKETERQTNNAAKLDAEAIADKIERRVGKLSPKDKAKLVRLVRETIRDATDVNKAMSRKRFAQNIGRKFGVNIKLVDTSKGGKALPVEGFYQRSTNTIFLDTKSTQSDMIYRVVLHELTHSIEQSGLYGEYANALLAMKYGTGAEAQARIRADTLAYQERYNRELPKMHEKDSTVDATPLTFEDAQKELVADLTYELLFHKKGGKKNDADISAIKRLTGEHESLAKRIWSALTRFLKKMAGMNDPALTRIEQVRDMFAQALEDARANRQVSEGRDQYALPTNGSWLSDEYADPASFEYMKSFKEQLEDLLNPDAKELLGNDALLIGETPKVLRDIGLPALPLTITQTHALYSIADTYQGKRSEKDDHKFSLNEFAKLPEKIADPIAVIAHSDPSKLLIYVSMKAKSGQQVIAPLVVDGYGTISNHDIDAHHVLTVHANEEMLQELQNAFEQDSPTDFRVYYFNKKRAAELGTDPRAQFSGTLPTGLIHKITDPESYVKMEIRSQTDTQQFKRWFHNSKVTDENGNPKVVYHGTASEFTVFEPQYVQNGETHPYFYFSNNREYAEQRPKLFDSRAESHVTEAYLSLQKPLYLESNGTRTVSEWQKALDRAGIKAGENYVQSVADAYGTDQLYGWQLFRNDTGEFRDACEDAGFDGIITTEKNGDTTYVAFEPTQIKSATDNIGLFDPRDPDIRYSLPVDNVNKSLREHGIEIDPSSGAAVQYSIRTSPQTQEEIEAAVARLVNSGLGFTEDEAKAWVESLNTVSSIILQHMMELDYENDPRYSWLKANSDYPQGSVDLNTNCPKRTQFTAIFDRLQKEFPDRVFTAQDYEAIRQKLIEKGVTVTCGPCFVEDRRQHTGEIAQGFIDQLNDGTLKPKFRSMIDNDTYVPTQYDLVTYDGFRKLYDEHRGIHDAFVAFNNARGMASARLVEGMAEYNNQIKKWSKRTIASKNSKGGLRIFSLSDADPRTMIDIIQITLDAAEKALMIQGYTKKAWFARMVKDTGMRILRSHIPKGNGIRNGEIWYDDVEGINRFDKNYVDANGVDVAESSPNIGDNIIGINDDMIRLAMVTREIDQIIPFHSSLANMIRNKKKIGDWVNYRNDQTEKDAATGTVAEKQINIYKDVINAWAAKGTPITNKVEFVNAFLQVCKDRGLTPRFAKFLNMENGEYVYTEGYEKFLVDYKLFDRDTGEIIPQVPVRAVFDDEFNRQVLEDYVNGVSEIVLAKEEDYQAVRALFTGRDTSFSLPEDLDDNYMAAVEAGEMDEAQRLVNEAARAAGYTYRAYHGTSSSFTTFKPGTRGEMWFSSTRETSYKDRGQVYDTYLKMNNPYESTSYYGENDFDPTKVTEEGRHNGHDGAITHFTTDPKYVERNRGLFKSDIKATDKFGDNFMFLPKGEIRASLAKDGETLMDFMERTSQEGLYDWYTVYNPNQIKSAEPVVYDDAGNVIPLSERFNDQSDDIRYSLPSDDLLDEMIRNYVGEELGEYGFPIGTNPTGTNTGRAATYSQHADPNAPNNNQDHARRMNSPQQIAKRLARKLHIGQAIGTRNMVGMPPQVLGFYERRVRAVRTRNVKANSFVVGMHELGHGIAEQLGMQGTPEMIARLPALFAQNYDAAALPGEAFAEFFWQYMTQDDKAVAFAGQDFIDQVEKAMRERGIYDSVQASRGEMLLWMHGSTFDQMRSVTRNRSEHNRMGIRDFMRTLVDHAVDATYAAERVNALERKQTGQMTLSFADDLRKNALMRNFAARQAFNILENNLTDADGTVIGDSLGTRLADAGFVATDENIDMLISYMLALHSLDRDAQHKPVFDEFITPQARKDFISRVRNDHQEIARAEEAFQRFRNEFLKAWMVDTGFLSQDALDQFNQMYPHYVPTLRVKDVRYQDQNRQGGRRYTIRRAVGSTEDIWNPMDSFVGMINSVVNMVATNRVGLAWEHAYRTYEGMGAFGEEITEDIEAQWVDLTELAAKIENILDTEVEDDVLQDVLDLMQDGMTTFRRTNRTTMPNGIMVQHADGTRSFFEIFDTELYKLLAGVQENVRNPAWETVGRLTRIMAGLTTGANPIFAARNFMRDFQTSVDYGTWASNYGTGFVKWLRAAYEVWTRGGEWADYEALGGGGWTRIEAGTRKGADEYRQAIYQKGYNTRNLGATARFVGRKIWNTLTFARLNEVIEQTSRYAEYRFGRHDKSTPEGRMDAFLAAQDVTVDFARKGNGALAQNLKQLIPFFGASVQGVNRTVRQFSEAERDRAFPRFVKTVINTALLSALAALTLLKFSDDDEKEEFVRMSHSLKSMHFYFPNFAPEILGEAPLIRIPVGQDPLMYAIHGAVTDMIWNGIGDSPAIELAAIANTILDNLNPLGNGTIFEATFGVMRNQTYYGGKIIPASLDGQAAGNQYSESTPDAFIGLGRLLHVSPNVIQYLAEQYTGFLGQIAIPMMSKTEGGHLGGFDALRDVLRRKFTSDPLTSNDVLNDFYDGRDQLDEIKAAGDSGRDLITLRRGLDEFDAEDAYNEAKNMLSTKGVVGSTAKKIKQYYAQIDEITADTTLTDHEKAEQIKELRREMIEMVLDAQEEIGDYKARYILGGNPLFDLFLPWARIEPQNE